MNSLLLLRLTLDFTAAGLLLFALAYYWQGNYSHELAGTAMFALVAAHNIFNRRWYGTLTKRPRERPGLINIVITGVLLTAMVTLLTTSIMISETLVGFLGLTASFSARQTHTLAAYLVLLMVSIHLGLRWPMLMDITRKLLGITGTKRVRTALLRVLALGIAIQGVSSSFALDIGTKLSLQLSLDWWNFEESVTGFFMHCLAVMGLYIVLSYYIMKGIRAWNGKTTASKLERHSR